MDVIVTLQSKMYCHVFSEVYKLQEVATEGEV
jgi:hypothetical protein